MLQINALIAITLKVLFAFIKSHQLGKGIEKERLRERERERERERFAHTHARTLMHAHAQTLRTRD